MYQTLQVPDKCMNMRFLEKYRMRLLYCWTTVKNNNPVKFSNRYRTSDFLDLMKNKYYIDIEEPDIFYPDERFVFTLQHIKTKSREITCAFKLYEKYNKWISDDLLEMRNSDYICLDIDKGIKYEVVT